MNILVAIKQVPDAADTRFDPVTRRLIREGVANIINPYDRRTISEGVRWRTERGGEVIVLTRGPPQAREALAEAIVMGADRGIHIEDRRMAVATRWRRRWCWRRRFAKSVSTSFYAAST